jgi:hypothetical protein
MRPRFQRGHPLLLDGKTQNEQQDRTQPAPRQVAEALAGWESAPGWKRSSGPATAATRNQPRYGALSGLPRHAWSGHVDAVAPSHRRAAAAWARRLVAGSSPMQPSGESVWECSYLREATARG